jgi:hypothetical protein
MADIILGRNVRVEVGLTEGVVTAASHGFANGDAVYGKTIVGMEEIEGQIFRVSGVATTFTMEGVNSTNFGTFVSGSFVKIQTWATLARVQTVTIPPGTRTRIPSTVLLDRFGQSLAGLAEAPEVTFEGISDVRSAGVKAIRDAAAAGAPLAFRISTQSPLNSEVRLFRLNVGTPGEVWGTDAIVTSGWSGTMVGTWMPYGL